MIETLPPETEAAITMPSAMAERERAHHTEAEGGATLTPPPIEEAQAAAEAAEIAEKGLRQPGGYRKGPWNRR